MSFESLSAFAFENSIEISAKQFEQLAKYKELIKEWNTKINLTSIKDDIGIEIKHFVDSFTCLLFDEVRKAQTIIDVGTGAGFPGVLLKIMLSNCKITLLDSVGKKLTFVKHVVDQLELENVEIVNARVEDFARNKSRRNNYDCAVIRGVSELRVLAEYCLPLLKINGHMLAMKGPKADEEIVKAQNAMKILGGKIEKTLHIDLPQDAGSRVLICATKIRNTLDIYPRSAGTPQKNPLK